MKKKLIEKLMRWVVTPLLGLLVISIATIIIRLLTRDWETAYHYVLAGCLMNLIGRGIVERVKE